MCNVVVPIAKPKGKLCRHKLEWHRDNAFSESAFCDKCSPKRYYLIDDFNGLSVWELMP